MSRTSVSPLKRARQKLGLTQLQLADSIGVSDSYISRVERTGIGMGKESGTRLWRRYGRRLRGCVTFQQLLRGNRAA